MNEISKWWLNSIIYHIYPRSFCDSNGDGIGDLRGIIKKADYVKSLGADAIWMGPVFESPQVDNGYDISDYLRVDTTFGTNQDLYDLFEEYHRRGLRVILDLVLNHTSDQHEWFVESRSSTDNQRANYYIWRYPASDGGPPNDWKAVFGGPAWTYCETRDQYYLHLFSPAQPDLNWEVEAVREEIREIVRFWLQRGADGFRLDVINHISKHPDLPELNRGSPNGVFVDGPKMLQFLQELRFWTRNISLPQKEGFQSQGEVFLVGETPGVSTHAAQQYTDPAHESLDSVIVFDHLGVDHSEAGKWEPRDWTVDELSDVVNHWQHALSGPRWPTVYMSNHDQPRVVSRYGNDSAFRSESAIALAAYFYLQRGTPIVFQGDEIGMRNYPIESHEDLQDIESRDAFRRLQIAFSDHPDEIMPRIRYSARDNGRTPMQWNDHANAGFCPEKCVPWYPVNPDYRNWNVKAMEADDTSVLNRYRELLALRKREPFITGAFRSLAANQSAAAYLRVTGSEAAIVIASLSSEPNILTVPKTPTFQMLFSNYNPNCCDQAFELDEVSLRPFEVIVASTSQ